MSIHATHEYVVYRCYGADDQLLYIGHAYDLEERIAIHRSSWSNPASAYLALKMKRYEGAPVVGKEAARAAERQAIWDEEPLLNIHHQKPAARAKAQAFRDDFTRPATVEELADGMAKVSAFLAPFFAARAEARPVPDVVVAGQTARSARRRRAS